MEQKHCLLAALTGLVLLCFLFAALIFPCFFFFFHYEELFIVVGMNVKNNFEILDQKPLYSVRLLWLGATRAETAMDFPHLLYEDKRALQSLGNYWSFLPDLFVSSVPKLIYMVFKLTQ